MGVGTNQVIGYFLGKFENREKAAKLFAKPKHDGLQSFMLNLFLLVEDMMEVTRAVSHEFKFWFKQRQKCCLYVRPASDKFDIYLASLTEEQIAKRAYALRLKLDISHDTSNENDQFHAKVTISKQWLDSQAGDPVAVLFLVNPDLA